MDQELVEGYEPTPQQLRAWTHTGVSSPPLLANVEIAVTGQCDRERLAVAVSDVLERHEIFATELEQIRGFSLPLAVYHHEPVWSSQIEIRDGQCVVILTGPGYGLDAWSLDPLCRELAMAYQGRLKREPEPLQYGDAAAWQKENLGESGRPSEVPVPAGSGLPYRIRRAGESGRVETEPVVLAPQTAAELVAAIGDGRTLEGLLVASFACLLAKVAKRVATIGVTFPGRRHPELGGAIGPYAHYLPIDLAVHGDESFIALAERATAEVAAAAHLQNSASWSPGRRLDEALGEPLRFGLDVVDCSRGYTADSVEFRVTGWQTFVDHCELRLLASRTSAGIALAFEFDTSRYEPPDIAHLADQFATLLTNALRDTSNGVAAHSILSASERELVTRSAGATLVEELGVGLGALLGRAARRTPTAPAAWSDGELVDYRELNRRVEGLAGLLAKADVAPGQLVGVHLAPGLDHVVAQLAILECGAVCVPLETDRPAPTGDQPLTVIATSDRVEAMDGRAGTLFVDQVDVLGAATDHTPVAVHPESLAYVASGPNDEDPGVMLSHRAVACAVSGLAAAFDIKPDDRLLWGAYPTDTGTSACALILALAAGAMVVCATAHDAETPDRWLDLVQNADVTIWVSSPNLFENVVEHAARRTDEPLASLRMAALNGECPSFSLMSRVNSLHPDLTVEYLHGFVESTAYSFRSGPARSMGGMTTLAGQSWYVLGQDREPCAVGVGGAVAIGGPSVGLGYFGSPSRTAECFVPDPYSHMPGARLFVSGDAGWWRSDGLLEHIGSLGCEVEWAVGFEATQVNTELLSNPAVRRAVTVVDTLRQNAAGPKLTSYVMSDASADQLRDILADRLPEHLVPTIVHVRDIPLTRTGQVDMSALLRQGASVPYVEPSTALETRLAELCAELLEYERVSMTDNFFDLGGHSLLLARLAGSLEEEIGAEVPLQDLFEAVDIREMARVVGACANP